MDQETFLDEIGGEPLTGSGFEDEQPELDFPEIAEEDSDYGNAKA